MQGTLDAMLRKAHAEGHDLSRTPPDLVYSG